jgi:primosomal protein N' (replication factor Y)
MPTDFLINVAIATPLRRTFTYRLPKNIQQHDCKPGCRVRVSFGRRNVIGVIVENGVITSLARNKIKPIDALIDNTPLWCIDVWQLLLWATRYYQHPVGEVMHTAMPALLRQGGPAKFNQTKVWFLTEHAKQADESEFKRAPRQLAVIKLLQEQPEGIGEAILKQQEFDIHSVLSRLNDKQYVDFRLEQVMPAEQTHATVAGPTLNAAQQAAFDTIITARNDFHAFLLDGVTGSGKTEVYLQLIRKIIDEGKQALVLVPEIGLTPQMIQRFQKRLGCPVSVLHSGLNDTERLHAWLAARDGLAPVILGTRSAIFTPMKNPGLIVIDEEHDASFKQHEGFRYSARDLAIWRAKHNRIPVVLGSATPSVESLYNVQQGRFTRIEMPQRAGEASPPKLHLLDMRSQPMHEGLTDRLLQIAQQHLDNNNQVLLFLNRRGFAPAMMCHECGWVAHCQRCDSNMTYHHNERRLRCHHCGAERASEKSCPQCQSSELLTVGAGTERIEVALQEKFTNVEIIRIDRDTTRRKGSLHSLLERVKNGQRQILLGTQMLAKGHHFPRVTMVGIIDADQGLHSAEFRAPERMAQLILQVAGRAGRAEQPGEVYIQTHHPDHPLLQSLIQQGYGAFAEEVLTERKQAGLPPFTAMALFRAEAPGREAPLAFLATVREILANHANSSLALFGPMPAPMEKRAGRYRTQLIVQAPQRTSLQSILHAVLPEIESLKSGQKVRWSLDVDPLDTY